MGLINFKNSANSSVLPGNLHDLKIKLKNRFPQLTDADLNSADGNENDTLRMIEYKLGKTKQEMREIIVSLYPFSF